MVRAGLIAHQAGIGLGRTLGPWMEEHLAPLPGPAQRLPRLVVDVDGFHWLMRGRQGVTHEVCLLARVYPATPARAWTRLCRFFTLQAPEAVRPETTTRVSASRWQRPCLRYLGPPGSPTPKRIGVKQWHSTTRCSSRSQWPLQRTYSSPRPWHRGRGLRHRRGNGRRRLVGRCPHSEQKKWSRER